MVTRARLGHESKEHTLQKTRVFVKQDGIHDTARWRGRSITRKWSRLKVCTIYSVGGALNTVEDGIIRCYFLFSMLPLKNGLISDSIFIINMTEMNINYSDFIVEDNGNRFPINKLMDSGIKFIKHISEVIGGAMLTQGFIDNQGSLWKTRCWHINNARPNILTKIETGFDNILPEQFINKISSGEWVLITNPSGTNSIDKVYCVFLTYLKMYNEIESLKKKNH